MRLLAALAALLALGTPALAADRPNIVFVLVDDLRYNGLGCTGHPFAKTPNIDRLAKDGANFTNAFVSTPLCSPSRSSFLTGQFVHTTGVIDNRDHSELSHKLVTFPKLLHDAGYATAYVGKWHMGMDDMPRPGFDRWVSFRGQGVYTNPPLNIDGQRVQGQGYMTDILNQHAVDFVKAQKGDKPFCLYVAHKAVHGPFTPADRHRDLYAGDRFPPTPSADDDRKGKPAITDSAANVPPKKKAAPKKKGQPKKKDAPPARKEDFGLMRNQMRCMASIDDGVGALLKALEEKKMLDNTVFVFTSDNGYFWGDHGGLGDKRWAYEEAIRIPLVMRYPKLVKAGTTVPQLVMNIDIAPTILDLAGAKIPADIQGKSFVPLLKGDTAGWRESMFLEYFQERNYPRTPTWQAVRTDKWKYIHYPGHADWDELYDLASDPNEMKNRIADPAAAAMLKDLKTELSRLREETGAKP
jgi:N-acetylglucosamine-6-sulfatase